MEVPDFEFDMNYFKDIYSPIQSMFTEEEYEDFCGKAALMEFVINQVNDVFKRQIIAEHNDSMQKNVEQVLQNFINNLREKYITNTLETKEIYSLPDLSDIVGWVETLYIDTFKQLFHSDFVDMAVAPAISSISEALLEFADDSTEVEFDVNEIDAVNK